MAAANETQYYSSVDGASEPNYSDPATEAFSAAKTMALSSAAATTGAPVRQESQPYQLPALPATKIITYRYDETAAAITATASDGVQVGDHRLARACGYDFVLMRVAAAMDGILLEINSAYREMGKQVSLYNERWIKQYNELTYPQHKAGRNTLSSDGRSKGSAAYPGTSNHQAGKAVDIEVHLTKGQFNSGKGQKSEVYRWLEKNAALFGFDNEEEPTEPWHWRHQSDSIVGSIEGLDVEGLRREELAALAKASTVAGARRFDILAAEQAIRARQRSSSADSSRDALLALAVAGKLETAAGRSEAAALAARNAQDTAGQVTSRGMTDGSEKQGFDFATGYWGDGAMV